MQWTKASKTLSLVATCLLLSGCGERVVYQQATGVVRLAEPVPAKVWVKDQGGEWVRGSNRVTLPDGAYVTVIPATQPTK